jgi:mono/diheme cytochrome c family protein
MNRPLTCFFLLLVHAASHALAHEAHGKKTAPASAKALKSPLTGDQAKPELGRPLYEKTCLSCHAADGKGQTAEAMKMKPKPTNIADHRMDSMADGEIYWVITNGMGKSMPGFKTQLNDSDRWRIVAYVRHLRKASSHSEHH